MHARAQELFSNLNKIFKKYKLPKDTFCVMYGSYPDGVAKSTSDIDLFVAIDEHDQKLFNDLQKLVVKTHVKFKIPLDEEVSFRNKLLVTFAELEKAARLNGMDMIGDKFIVPDLIKNESYLESEQIKLRLLFNALSTPHYVFRENDYYFSLKDRVIENLFWLAVDLLDVEECTIDQIIGILFESRNLRKGENYLGYKFYPKVIEKIRENIENTAIRLNNKGMIFYDYITKSIDILNAIPLRALKDEFIGSSKKFISDSI